MMPGRAVADGDAMEQLGQELAAGLEPGSLVYLHGPLGAGKTTLARGILRGLGYAGSVKSPTYTLVESYRLPGGGELHHFDLYRLGDPEELELIGIRDYLDGEARCLVEWPERGAGVLDEPDLQIAIAPRGSERLVSMDPKNRKGRRILNNVI